MVFTGKVTSDFLKLIPTDLDNKEKLLDYSAGDYASFRDALINYAKAVYPLDYTNFSESDFGMFLIELMAAVGHIQSFKSDYLANENFLKTARERNSVKKLLELVGVRMKGPISSAANARITIQNAPANVSSITINPENRIITIASPQDNGPLTFTLYKVNTDGTVDLKNSSNDLEFNVSSSNGTVVITDAVLLEGALIIETGVFNDNDTVKTVALSQSPYVERSAQVYIEGSDSTEGVYREEENIYFASGGSDKVFQITTNDDFKPTVIFGDSTIGLSPSIGDSYTISYRVGGGSRGNIASEVINSPLKVIFNGGSEGNGVLENSSLATGGADAETIAKAKRYAPLVFRSQDRLVTLEDYIGFANSFISNYGSTGKANAVVRRAYSSANIIDLFVLEKASDTQLRKATPEYKKQLLEAIQDKKMLTDEPVIVDGLIRTLDIITTITIDKRYKNFETEVRNKVVARILEYFDVGNSDFGEPFVPQDLIKFILELSEVRYATIDNINSTIRIDFNEIIQLNNFTVNVSLI
ncbi:MAG: hypothetical protein RL348_1637 [Bacteroidota bacterium]|jgi:hypothetical protein